jgi:hypothetical protein
MAQSESAVTVLRGHLPTQSQAGKRPVKELRWRITPAARAFVSRHGTDVRTSQGVPPLGCNGRRPPALVAGRLATFRAEVESRAGVLIPNEDPDYQPDGDAWPDLARPRRAGLLQPPSPIMPRRRRSPSSNPSCRCSDPTRLDPAGSCSGSLFPPGRSSPPHSSPASLAIHRNPQPGSQRRPPNGARLRCDHRSGVALTVKLISEASPNRYEPGCRALLGVQHRRVAERSSDSGWIHTAGETDDTCWRCAWKRSLT